MIASLSFKQSENENNLGGPTNSTNYTISSFFIAYYCNCPVVYRSQ